MKKDIWYVQFFFKPQGSQIHEIASCHFASHSYNKLRDVIYGYLRYLNTESRVFFTVTLATSKSDINQAVDIDKFVDDLPF